MNKELEFQSKSADLVTVRNLSHAAIQWPSRAARANLPARSDDGHSNLGWLDEHAALVGHPLDAKARFQLGFSFKTGSMIWLEDGRITDALSLTGRDEAAVEAWCDKRLLSAGLVATGAAEMPYALDPVSYEKLTGADGALQTLGAWFAATQAALDALVAGHGSKATEPPSVRCWPHHYDLATLFLLDKGDLESVRSVGIGVSPGDSFYPEPYLYCNPWPVPELPLPEPPQPLRWHTEGFTSLVCSASQMSGPDDLASLAEVAFLEVLDFLQT